jgi:hypothetical protein
MPRRPESACFLEDKPGRRASSEDAVEGVVDVIKLALLADRM